MRTASTTAIAICVNSFGTGDVALVQGTDCEEDHRDDEARLNNADAAASQRVLHAGAHDHAYVERAAHDDHIGHGDREQRHQHDAVNQHVVISEVPAHNERIEYEKKCGAHGDRGSPIEHLEAAAFVMGERRDPDTWRPTP